MQVDNFLRVQMLQDIHNAVSDDGYQDYFAGLYYMLEATMAQQWITDGKAVDPDAPRALAEESSVSPPSTPIEVTLQSEVQSASEVVASVGTAPTSEVNYA